MAHDSFSSLRLAYYGDDFTGSTDVLEALSIAGVRTALFLAPPTPAQLARHPELAAVGVAGLGRAMSPAQMAQQLPAIFKALRALNPAVVHYKICSTFDSSPTVGSIGCAIELGQQVFNGRFVPLVVGAPVLGRYCVFGNLHARSGGDSDIYRLDRHPTMSCHPATPMDEADLLRHLARQTDLPTRLINVLELARDADALDALLAKRIEGGQPIVLFDTLTDDHLLAIGRVIWQQALDAPPLFAVGSSGLEYALTAHWRATGEQAAAAAASPAAEVDRLLVVSGSCSPVTGRQIARAEEAGFATLALSPEQLVPGAGKSAEVLEPTIAEALRLLGEGRSVIVHACRGPRDARLDAVRDRAARRSAVPDMLPLGEVIGGLLGHLLSQLVQRADLPRVAVTGGDTSGYVGQQMGIEFLRFAAPIAPGSPLCIAHAPGHALHGREIVFKGGQVGKDDFFLSVMRGRP